MAEAQRFADEGVLGRRYDYSDHTLFVADFGYAAEASVDLVDGTVIVVVDGEQYEFDLPAGGARASINNGVLTVEVDEVTA